MKLPELPSPPPEPLAAVLADESSKSKHFSQNMRTYNSCFQMKSFGATHIVSDNYMMLRFKVRGQIYQRARSVFPVAGADHNYVQIYFVRDKGEQVIQRCPWNSGTGRGTVKALQTLLDQHHELIRLFRTALEQMPEDDYI